MEMEIHFMEMETATRTMDRRARSGMVVSP